MAITEPWRNRGIIRPEFARVNKTLERQVASIALCGSDGDVKSSNLDVVAKN